MKNETNYTPGPWRTGDIFNTVFGPKRDTPSPAIVATVHRANQANARLIASAPELLEALEGLASVIPLHELNVRKHFDLLNHHAAALKAIAKAKGAIQ